MKIDNTIKAFFALLQGGLWEREVHLLPFGDIDFEELMRLSEEQAVVGLVTAGMEHVSDVKIPQVELLKFIGQSLQIEQQNFEMNQLVGDLVEKMRTADIYTLLIKGQGIAQCYERSLWRASGDVDFYLSEDNFQKAKSFFRPLVESFDPNNDTTKHINMHYGQWIVEIHANQHCTLSYRINCVMDEIHNDLFYNGNVRSWNNKGNVVFLPSVDNDVLIVFIHFLNHFYKGGIGVRQVCDWCRLLWIYRKTINLQLLEKRICKMGVMPIWKSFAAFAVDYLGMPAEAMPFYSVDKGWKRKGDRICSFILEVGNFGHNRDTNYYGKYPRMCRKVISFGRRFGDVFRHTQIFPISSLRFAPFIFYYGVKAVVDGE